MKTSLLSIRLVQILIIGKVQSIRDVLEILFNPIVRADNPRFAADAKRNLFS